VAAEKLPRADAARIVEHLTACLESSGLVCGEDFVWAGSWRRGAEAVGDLDLVLRERPADEAFQSEQGVDLLRGGPSRAHYAYGGLQVDVWTYDSHRQRGAMLLFATGPGRLNIILRTKAQKKGWLMNQYGVWDGDSQVDDGTEQSILELLDMDGRHLEVPAERSRYS